MPITEHAQNLATLRGGTVNLRKLMMEHQLQDQFRIAAVVFLAPAGAPTNLGRVAEPDLVPQFFQQLFEPGGITTGLEAHDYRTAQLFIELTYRFLVVVLELVASELSGFSFQTANCLLTCMKVDAAIYNVSHSGCLLSVSCQPSV